MNRITTGATLALLLASTPLAAQEAQPSRFHVEPYAGAFQDAYDISPDGSRTGLLLGLRVGYALDDRMRLVGTIGRVTSDDVADPQGLEDYLVYRNNWALTTVGAEYDLIPGRTSVTVGAQIGAGWRSLERTGEVGSPAFGTDWHGGGGYSPVDVVVPGIALRREIGSRTALTLSVQDHMFDVLEGPLDHSPAVSLGLSYR